MNSLAQLVDQSSRVHEKEMHVRRRDSGIVNPRAEMLFGQLLNEYPVERGRDLADPRGFPRAMIRHYFAGAGNRTRR
jgi:hypothetical protein